jgi:predicted transcriptional regulator
VTAERRGGWPGPRKPNTNVRLDPALTQRLRDHATATGQTVTAVVEAALSAYLAVAAAGEEEG